MQKRGDEVSLFWPLGRPWKRERRGALMRSWWKCVEVGILERLEFWKMEKLVACGGRKEIKEKEKGKEIHMRRYFLGLKK